MCVYSMKMLSTSNPFPQLMLNTVMGMEPSEFKTMRMMGIVYSFTSLSSTHLEITLSLAATITH